MREWNSGSKAWELRLMMEREVEVMVGVARVRVRVRRWVRGERDIRGWVRGCGL